jgi:biopolymer transport protein ExbD
MSHGGGSSNDNSEPNLTPLLDMVLQLVMFFMMVANFTMEQVNTDIKLPIALSAQAVDKTEMEDVLYLNVNLEGHVMVTGRQQPLKTPVEIEVFLADKYKDFQRRAEEKGESNTEVKALVIIRGDRRASYKDVYNVLQKCKQVGFRKWQVRAQTKAGPSS